MTSLPAGGVDSNAGTTSLSHLITGLANGTAYTFSVQATNVVGTGTASAPSAAVTPMLGAPTTPLSVTAVAGNKQATVSFAAPANNGGSAILGYTVTASPGGKTAVGVVNTLTVTGLTNGTAYTFTVTARNALGTSPASAPSAAVTPGTVPNPPTAVKAVAGDTQATVSFKPPTNTGLNPILYYAVTSTPGNISAIGTASPIVVTGLTNGTRYTFKVTAVNAIGISRASTASAGVTPAMLPGAPTIGAATRASATSARVTFTAPASNGGSKITRYTVTATPGGRTSSGTTSPRTVSGLTTGTTYTFTVFATNAVGNGPASAASNPVTP